MKRLLCSGLLLAILLTACSSVAISTPIPKQRALTVFAAASLTDAFTEIGESFEAANPGVTVTFNFAGSQALRTQIEEGAPADVFASANAKEMDTLVDGKYVDSAAPQIILNNKLVVILPAENPAGIATLGDLATPGIKLVLAAEEVPVGNYARQSLELMNGRFGTDFQDSVLDNVVSNEDNVKQVVAKVQLGEADAGIVYKSDARAAAEVKSIQIPDELNIIAEYPIAPLSSLTNADLARAFVQFVLSDEGQVVLEKWGFSSPQ
jgi:molybdate transport system substrate-binding protein